MKVLLTGNEGLIGRELAEVLEKENAIEVHGLGLRRRTLDRDSYERWQVLRRHFFQKTKTFDYVIHCGAVSDSRRTDVNLWHLNYAASCEIADYCERTDTKLIYFSSAAAIRPETAYGYSKQCAEFYMHHTVAGMNLCVLRPFNVWCFDEQYKANPSIVYKILTGQLEKIYRDCVRDFVYLTDITNAIQQVIHDWTPGTFSLGSTHGMEILTLVEAISDKKIPIVPCPVDKEIVASEGDVLPGWSADPITEYLDSLRKQCRERANDIGCQPEEDVTQGEPHNVEELLTDGL